MNNNLNSTLAEQASNNNVAKRVKAKEIFLGIDVHLRSRGAALSCASLRRMFERPRSPYWTAQLWGGSRERLLAYHHC